MSAASPNSRRQFLKTAAAASVGMGAMSASSISADTATLNSAPVTEPKSGSVTRMGSGDHVFEADHNFLQLPSKYTWQTTHNVATDGDGRIYVIHEGDLKQPDHPAIFVFHPDGRFIKAFGNEFQGGGHGLEVRREGDDEFLYVTAYQSLKFISKLTLDGETVWKKNAPMESGRYADGEATSPAKVWGRDRFMPTNFAFLSDGRMLLADGYGSYAIHVYDADGNYERSFGTEGKADGEFHTPHGLWVDNRGTDELICVADRANGRLQWFQPDGTHVRTQDGFMLPANIDVQNDLLLVPELKARITLLDADNKPIVRLGNDAQWRQAVTANKNQMRKQPSRWEAGKFVHPHDACFDADGNILVAEWVQGGRVSRLNRV